MALKSGKLWALAGSSRSGKTQRALKEIERHKCALIWDIEGAYKADHRAGNLPDLFAIVRAYAGKPARIAYTGTIGDFPEFCKIAWWYVRRCCQLGKYSALVFEETSDVTSPAKAPPDYGIILRRALKYGVDIFAISQRPSESDKTSVGNASVVHICRLNLPIDRKYMAAMTGIPQSEIDSLRADQDTGVFDYITVDTGRRCYRRGTLSFPGGKAKYTPKGKEIPL